MWSHPKSRDVGFFTDIDLYSEALGLADENESITSDFLKAELRQRLRGLMLVERQSRRVARDLIRELREFGWLQKLDGAMRSVENTPHQLVEQGKEALKISKTNPKAFRRILTEKMFYHYVIPGWFVARLWQINHNSQGTVILPSPHKEWRPESRFWEQKEWTKDLEREVLRSLETTKKISPESFPIANEAWIKSVKQAWIRLGELKQKKVSKRKQLVTIASIENNQQEFLRSNEIEKIRTFAPRSRLALAMREAAIFLLFNPIPPGKKEPEFDLNKHPLPPRSFRAWCPRLEALELIFYTDSHPYIPGRLIFPTAVFRKDAPCPPFENLENIKNPKGETLWLHQPRWDTSKELFVETLFQTHQSISTRIGSLYVSLLNVRDEVCRQLRLSSILFDDFLEKIFHESLCQRSPWSISLETDIREDQRGGSALIRRPIWIRNVPYSLIAMTKNF